MSPIRAGVGVTGGGLGVVVVTLRRLFGVTGASGALFVVVLAEAELVATPLLSATVIFRARFLMATGCLTAVVGATELSDCTLADRRVAMVDVNERRRLAQAAS